MFCCQEIVSTSLRILFMITYSISIIIICSEALSKQSLTAFRPSEQYKSTENMNMKVLRNVNNP